MPVQIHGKAYVTVAERIQLLNDTLHKQNKRYSLTTNLISWKDQVVVFKATLVIYDYIEGTEVYTKYTGHAYEKEGSNMINKTSALENCETSAIGRAISAAGFTGGNEYASADEVANAIINQDQKKDKPTEKQRTMLYGLIKKITDEDIQKELIESAKECKTRWDMSMLIDKVVKM